MILKKPYAFIIKHFRLINFLLAALAVYACYRTYNVFGFFSEYIANNYSGSFYEGFYSSYISMPFYLTIILILILLGALCLLFLYKKKPNKWYLTAGGYYIILIILLVIVKNIMVGMEETVISAEAARAYRDISLIVWLPQFSFIVLFLMYGFGFNLSKFNFKQDLKDLQVSEEDSEEVEITLRRNNVKVKRNLRRLVREFGYYVRENKFIFIIICIFLTGGLIYIIFNSLPEIVDQQFSQGDSFVYNNVNYKVEDSIITNLDYRGNTLKDKYYLVVRLYAKNDTKNNQTLKTNNLRLEVNKRLIYPSADSVALFVDYAKAYSGNDIKANTENRLSLIYELNSNEIKKNYQIKINNGSTYSDGNEVARYNYVSISPVIIDKVVSEGEYEMNKEVSFTNSNLRNTKFTVTDMAINNSYTYEYQSCVKEGDCETYKNIINVTHETSDKTLLLLGYKYEIDKDIPFNTATSNVNSFITAFARIRYHYKGEEITEDIKNLTPNSDKTKLVLQVSNKIKDATKIWLQITVRNKKYSIKLK